jgi:hypothetical protein
MCTERRLYFHILRIDRGERGKFGMLMKTVFFLKKKEVCDDNSMHVITAVVPTFGRYIFIVYRSN